MEQASARVGTGAPRTFLFTDIESSTPRWQEDEAAMAASLAGHDEMLSEAVGRHGGRVFKHTGDGICAVFDSARSAVAAAADAQAALELPVRMGLHTGEAEERDGDFFGPTLNRCARIMDAGHGGQILCSAATWELVAGRDGLEGVDLGDHGLRGLDRAERIHQIGSAVHPPLRTSTPTTSLPVVLTSLVGREELIEDVTDRLTGSRLITLVGVGGVGKTRVALAVAQRWADDLDVTVFVNLTEVSDEDDVPAAVARSLGVRTPTTDAILGALSARDGLLVLDNCEHVIDAAADLVESLLGGVSSLRVIATSREGLAIDGEQIAAVPGLDTDGHSSVAAGLFVDRARAADPAFEVDDAAVIEEICTRLDGLPLAIELAAARVAVLSPPDLLARLDERFQVLTGGRRRRSRDRQRTLRETVDWSHDLLDADEQEAFARLSVFAGSFGLDGATTVLDGYAEYEVVDLLEALVGKSLLNVGDVDGFRRYRYLETIRSYAEDSLDGRGETDATMGLLHRHLATVVGVSFDAVGFPTDAGARRIGLELANLRRAFDHALDRADLDAAAELVAPFGFCPVSSYYSVLGWADEVLDAGDPRDLGAALELRILRLMDRWLSNRFGEVRALTGELLDRSGRGDRASARVNVAASAMYTLLGDVEAAMRCIADVRSVRSDGDADLLLDARLLAAANVLVPPRPDDHVEFGASWDLEADIERGLRHPLASIRARAELCCAQLARRRGEYGEMLHHARAAERIALAGASYWFFALQVQSWAEYLLEDWWAALRSADRDLDEAHRRGDRSAMVLPTTIYALVLRAFDEAEAAATVRGGLAPRLTIGLVDELRALDTWLGERLDPDRLAELADRGRAMTRRELQVLTHEVSAPHLVRSDRAGARADSPTLGA